MNTMGHMKDPAAGMPPQLLAHMHLISKHRYPIIANPSLEMIVSFLMEAPKIIRDVQPVQWQFLDAPADGSLLLTWQPLEYLGTNFASDGYVWADAEQPFTSMVQGYRLEILMHRSGYKAAGESVAGHSRKRYRLLPGNTGLGLPTPDPALWLVHYARAATRDHVPAASIPVQPQVQASLQQRRVIQTQGQLARKEFMLHDRTNWPVITLPPSMTGRPGSGPMVPGGGHRRGGSMNAPMPEPTIEEEEDVSRGDALDLVTPREISRMRYEQQHEWMEEILESPYNIKQIVPSSLGLGRKGELESLTKGFFELPSFGANNASNGTPARVGKMDPGKAAEFTRLAAQKVADMQKELEDMKAKHARRMEKLRQSSVLATAEKKLRTAYDGGEAGDPEKQELGSSTDDIVQGVESAWGRKIERVQSVTILQRGGLEDPAPRLQSSMSARTMSGASQNRPFAGSFGHGTPGPELRQSPMMQQQGFQQQSVPQPQPTPEIVKLVEPAVTIVAGQQAIPSIASETVPETAATSESQGSASEPGTGAEVANDSGDVSDDLDMGEAINMDGLDDPEEPSADTENQDWVMVDEDANQTPDQQVEVGDADITAPSIPTEQVPPQATAQQQQPQTEEKVSTPVEESTVAKESILDQQAKDATEAEVQDSLPDSGMDSGDLGLGDDFDSVGMMDTAGDALAQYDEGDDLDLDNMDDSAFGDAFHPPDD